MVASDAETMYDLLSLGTLPVSRLPRLPAELVSAPRQSSTDIRTAAVCTSCRATEPYLPHDYDFQAYQDSVKTGETSRTIIAWAIHWYLLLVLCYLP